ncbi:hypothetical protein Clacol_009507 [Clathrus columnatus]|uniref:Major facilitator superfamily (MFS) profile domain-containing protein n=1 Tax=Clathrus columnatus TaxID=1419009 RepID=A0AAV5ASB1_9AGAM|nr:hypothetical protein Clacol_009507 [Clathrus columnatus]
MSHLVVSDELTPLIQNDNANTSIQDERSGNQIEDSERNQVETNESNTPTPLPLRAVSIIMLLRAMNPLAFEIIFPFINQMVLEVGVVDNPEEVGFYSGLIESIFSLVSLVTADHVGRKPIILWGTLAMALSTAFFGMSKTLLAMILTRCIGGATGSVWVATKTVMGEYTDRTNQGKAFQLITVAYRTGQILGLPLGGLLAHPERNFSPFRSRFWVENPFALPCFVSAAVAIVSVILGYFFLDETLKPKEKRYNNFESSEATDIDNHGGSSLKEILTPQVVGLLLNNTLMCFVSEVLFAL